MPHYVAVFATIEDMRTHTPAEESRVRRPRRVLIRKADRALEALNSARISVDIPSAAHVERAYERAAAFIQSFKAEQGIDVTSAPHLCVVAVIGSSGVGKSYVARLLTGSDRIESSVLRPGTLTPVAVVHPSNSALFEARCPIEDVCTEVDERERPGIALVDTPAFDWGHPQLYRQALKILDMCDAVIFVTTAYRYGDAAAWDILERLRRRGVHIAGVLNRIPENSDGSSAREFQRLWVSAGLGKFPLFSLCEHGDGEFPELSYTSMPSNPIRGRHARAAVEEKVFSDGSEGDDLSDVTAQTGAESCSQEQGEGRSGLRRSRRRRRHRHAEIIRTSQAKPQINSDPGRIMQWCESLCAERSRHSYTAQKSQALADFIADTDMIADTLDELRNAIVDLTDQAGEGAAAPFDKLATNIRMGRFGQGTPSVLWDMLSAGGGELDASRARKQNSRKQNSRKQSQRDAELEALFETISAGVKMAINQGMTTARINIETAWNRGFKELDQHIEKSQADRDMTAFAEAALTAWHEKLMRAARDVSNNSWLGEEGWAYLLGIAAAGVSGAMEMTRKFGIETPVREAREALTNCVHEAFEQLVDTYTRRVCRVAVADSAQLRSVVEDFVCAVEGSDV